MDSILAELEASTQAKVEADVDFLSSIATLSDEEKTQKIEEKKSELLNTELIGLREGSEKAKKAQELADNYKIRAEKAEAAAKGAEPLAKGALSQNDVLYLAKAEIHEDDMAEVVDYAKLKKISVKDAHAFMKPILDVHAEERRTANATDTRRGARGSSQVSGADLLAQAERGEDVALDDEKANKIFQARLDRKTSRFKHRK